MNTKIHTDIKRDRWVGALPKGLQPYILLARLDRPVGIWLLLLPGWWAIVLASGGVTVMNVRDWAIFALFGAGAVVMRAAGCVINDLWDRKMDRQVERTKLRPLAAGTVSPAQALVFLSVLLATGFVILLQFNIMTILLGLLSLPLIIAYPLMKRWTWWPQAFLGLTFNFGALMGWAAVAGSVDLSALLLYAAGILWTLGYDTIYAHQDKEDDALAGVKSTALKLGPRSRKFVAVFYALCWLLIAAACGSVLPVLLLLPAGAHLMWQVKRWDMDDAASSLKIFRSNRDFGLLVLAALALVVAP